MRYDPKAPSPDRWLTFLHELLDDADIPTLQEYLGYCLIPSTKGQKMMLIVGKGGEGKSRIGLVLKRLMGCLLYTSYLPLRLCRRLKCDAVFLSKE